MNQRYVPAWTNANSHLPPIALRLSELGHPIVVKVDMKVGHLVDLVPHCFLHTINIPVIITIEERTVSPRIFGFLRSTMDPPVPVRFRPGLESFLKRFLESLHLRSKLTLR